MQLDKYPDISRILAKSIKKALKRILSYLKKTKNFGFFFGGWSSEICGYCDSDYAGDLESRRSQDPSNPLLNGAVSCPYATDSLKILV
jgi:hypothetical protein